MLTTDWSNRLGRRRPRGLAPGSTFRTPNDQFVIFAVTLSEFLIRTATFGYNEQRERRRWARPSRAISVAAIHGLLDASDASAAVARQLNDRGTRDWHGSSWILTPYRMPLRPSPE